MEQLTQLRFDMESAELDTLIAEAQEKAAMARQNTKLLDLESFNVEHKSDSIPWSHTSSPGSPPLPASPHSAGGTHSPMKANDFTGFMALLQSVQDSALAQLQRAEERAGDAQLAALATRSVPAAPESAAPKVSTNFKSNDCYKM